MPVVAVAAAVVAAAVAAVFAFVSEIGRTKWSINVWLFGSLFVVWILTFLINIPGKDEFSNVTRFWVPHSPQKISEFLVMFS